MRVVASTLMLFAVLGLGCVSNYQELCKGPQVAKSAPTIEPQATTAPVTAAQVTHENARALSRALGDELDHQEQADSLKDTGAKAPPQPK